MLMRWGEQGKGCRSRRLREPAGRRPAPHGGGRRSSWVLSDWVGDGGVIRSVFYVDRRTFDGSMAEVIQQL
jgi:hypothetical protein